MKAVEKLLEEVKKGKRPTAAENSAVARIAAEFVTRLDKALKAAKAGAKPVVGGSGAKGTWLRGMHDIDVFACFDYEKYKEKSGELSEFVAAAMKKTFSKHERLHGSRDYFRVHFSGYNFEIVPILRITRASQAKNITDASLLHSAWVRRKISKKAALADDVRLTKAFCKAQRVYGAESHIRGFSGYACEVLTVYYGSFLKLVTTAAGQWKKQVEACKKIVVDAEKHYKGHDPLRELNEAKVQSELIVIDPVQKDRNATAALSNETLQRFIEAAGDFLKKPGREFFERQEITIEDIKQKAKGKKLVIVEAAPNKGKEDVVGAKLLKAHEHLLKELLENGFAVKDTGWEWDKSKKREAMFWYITEKSEPEAEVRYGPPLANKAHADNFRKEHAGKSGRRLFEKKGRLYAEIERPYKRPEQLISHLIAEDNYLKDKAQHYSARSFN
ncbi:CCA tRNA nucleotidyltransferase [Candidatus Woesearchaeota archaeon]|nr:CCA tRNA nucleotidyltransferase [Candidatus Woesearchaeota archaeon]